MSLPRASGRSPEPFFERIKVAGCPPKSGEIFDPIESLGHDILFLYFLDNLQKVEPLSIT
jgi:hypothetical protein